MVQEMQDWTLELGLDEPPQPMGRLEGMLMAISGERRGKRSHSGSRHTSNSSNRSYSRYGSRNASRERFRGDIGTEGRGDGTPRWYGRGSSKSKRSWSDREFDFPQDEEASPREPYKRKWNVDYSLGRSQFGKQFDREWKSREQEKKWKELKSEDTIAAEW
jgi:hypothetical protein